MAGRCNNKWTAEEEAAIKNGIRKHGVGKWRVILNDPEFSSALRNRTNVSLKDKWRTIKGYKPVQKIIKKPSRYYTKSVSFTSEGSDKDKIAQPDAPAMIYETSEDENFDQLISRFHDFKLADDLTNAKQLSTSMLKQEQLRPPNLKRFLYGNTNPVAANEKFYEEQKEPEYDSEESDRRAKAAVDAEVWRIKVMTPEDAAAAAAAAVTMAEAAIAEAEEAEREAVEAERLAEEKKFIAEELARKLEEKKARAAAKQGKQGRRRNW